MGNIATIIECSPDQNIVYTVTEMEYNLINNALENWRMINGKYPKISFLIENFKKMPEMKEMDMFNNIKIEKKSTKKIKGMEATYIFYDDIYEKWVDKEKNLEYDGKTWKKKITTEI